MKHENLIELLKSEDRYFSKEEICENYQTILSTTTRLDTMYAQRYGM